jgi:hypothetical protein
MFATKLPFHWLANPAPDWKMGTVTEALPVRSSAMAIEAGFWATF